MYELRNIFLDLVQTFSPSFLSPHSKLNKYSLLLALEGVGQMTIFRYLVCRIIFVNFDLELSGPYIINICLDIVN